MATVIHAQAATAFRLFAIAHVHRRNELHQFEGDNYLFDSDENNDSDAPIFDRFYEQGGFETVLDMTNFELTKFLAV